MVISTIDVPEGICLPNYQEQSSGCLGGYLVSPMKRVCLLLLLSVLLVVGQASESVAEPPIALDLSTETDEGELIPITLEASDVDGDNLTFVIKTPPQKWFVI